jgi:hypothetical protein
MARLRACIPSVLQTLTAEERWGCAEDAKAPSAGRRFLILCVLCETSATDAV